jgi:hypothetical protein
MLLISLENMEYHYQENMNNELNKVRSEIESIFAD